MKCLPSGRHHGQRWVVCVALLITVAGLTAPPCALTFASGPIKSGANTITSLALQLPPREFGESAMGATGPPAAAILISLPPAKKPILLPPGDQKGCEAAEVPSRACAESLFRERTHTSLV